MKRENCANYSNKFKIGAGHQANVPQSDYHSNPNPTQGSHTELDENGSKKSKPFRIKDMGNADYMNHTGTSTTTSSNTNKTMPNTLSSRRDTNERSKQNCIILSKI